jgi:hypothetical protein
MFYCLSSHPINNSLSCVIARSVWCVLLVLCVHRKSAAATTHTVLYERFFPHLSTCLLGTEPASAASTATASHLFAVAGKTLASIERQLMLAALPSAAASTSSSAPASASAPAKSSGSESKAAPAPVQYDINKLWDALSEVCVNALVLAQSKPSAAAAVPESGAAAAAVVMTPVAAREVYERVSSVMSGCERERQRLHATRHDLLLPALQASDSALQRVAANVLAMAWTAFDALLTPAPLRYASFSAPRFGRQCDSPSMLFLCSLVVSLARTFGLSVLLRSNSALLQSRPNASASDSKTAAALTTTSASASGIESSSEFRFLLERALPVLFTLCACTKDSLSPKCSTEQSLATIDVYCSLLHTALQPLVAAERSASAGAAVSLAPFWEQLFAALSVVDSERSPLGVHVLRHVLSRLYSSAEGALSPALRHHPRLDALLAAQAACFLRCDHSQRM